MFTFFPKDDKRQALRIRRFMMAVASYLMVIGLMFFCYWNGWFHMSLGGTLIFYILILAINAGYYVIFRTGWNKHFRDPSLTLLQMITAVLVITVVLYFSDEVRGVMLMLFLITFVFGVFRLSVKQFLLLALFPLVGYGLVIWMLVLNRSESINIRMEILHWIILATVLPWFSLLGGYISRLRDKIGKTNSELLAAIRTIEHMAIHDELTKVYNRRYLDQLLNNEKARADRGFPAFSVGIIDLDHFKRINDEFGHLAGDTVLQVLVQEIKKDTRSLDHLSRFGGEEFVLVMTHTGLSGAVKVADRMRRRAETLSYPGLPDSCHVTISIGVTEYCPVEPIEMTLARADSALYQAKQNGRNRTEKQPRPHQPASFSSPPIPSVTRS